MDKKYSNLPGVRKIHDFMIVRGVKGEVVMKLRTHCHTRTPIESPLHVVDPTQSDHRGAVTVITVDRLLLTK